MKTAQGGYKAMIRDRVPRTVDLALKWCKAKTRWVELVYYTYIWFLREKDARDYQTRQLLGIGKYSREFKFENTIEWSNLDKDEKEYWTNVSTWVNWFEKSLLPIVETYSTLKLKGKTEEEIKSHIVVKYFDTVVSTWKDKLYEYLINHIKLYYV